VDVVGTDCHAGDLHA